MQKKKLFPDKAGRNWKSYMVILPLSAITLFVSLPEGANAQFAITSVIGAAVSKVIKAIDLQVQRMQNQTIWLQNAQKALENQLHKAKLEEISVWSQKQKELYEGYYTELGQVKAVISDYERVREVTARQASLVTQYHHGWDLLKSDPHFTVGELAHMQQVYAGILQESVRNLDEILLVVSSLKTQMTDAQRLELIDQSAAKVDHNCSDLKRFNNQNYLLSIQRSKSEDEVFSLKKYYGID